MTAIDGADALEKAREKVFELVLSYVNMPNMSGINLVSKLRLLPGYEYIPIVMVTTENAEDRKNKARSPGGTG